MSRPILLRASTLIDPYVQADAHVETSIRYTTPLHFHDYFEVFIITEGRCVHEVNGREQYLDAGDLVFIRPGDAHAYAYRDESTDCRFINVNFLAEAMDKTFRYFGEPSFEQNMKNSELPPSASLPVGEMKTLAAKGEQIRIYMSVNKSRAKILAKSFLADVLALFFSRRQGKNEKADPAWLDALLLQMQKKENFVFGARRMSALSGMSSGHLDRVFRQYLHTTPTAYVNWLRLNYARELLLNSDLDVLEVSLEAGYENLSHFYHLFRESFGLPPIKFRREHTK